MVFTPMQGDDSSNDESFSVPPNTTTPPESHNNGTFAAELRDLELRLEQLELEQRSLRIQLQRIRLRHAEHTTTPSTPPMTPPRQQEPSVLTEVCYLLEVSWKMCHAWITHWTVARAILTMSRRRSTRDERTHGGGARKPLLART